MNHSENIAPIAELKAQAKRLRARLQASGTHISHSEALELIAHQNGARDWNTLRASTGNMPPLPKVGGKGHGPLSGPEFCWRCPGHEPDRSG